MRFVKILERILIMIPIVLGVAIIVFLFMRLMPGDPVDIMMGQGGSVSLGEIENLREEFNLDKPLYVQLGIFLGDLLHGDLGILTCKKGLWMRSSWAGCRPLLNWLSAA